MLDYNMVYKFWFYLPFYPFVLNPTTIIFYLHFVCIELDIAKHCVSLILIHHVHTFISDFLFKFLVIGSAGTGKSCILHQFIENKCEYTSFK